MMFCGGQADCSFKPPEFLVQAAKDALDDVAANQYSHTRGRLRLRQALCDAYSPYFGRKLDPETVDSSKPSELMGRKS